MKQDERRLAPDDIFFGIDLATRQHQVVVLDLEGRRKTSFKIPHSRDGLRELVQRCNSPGLRQGVGRVHFGFEATGHIWEAVAAYLEARKIDYQVVNPFATFRVREARQMGRDKRDLTDAEEIAHLLRTGVVKQCQLLPPEYMQLRRAWLTQGPTPAPIGWSGAAGGASTASTPDRRPASPMRPATPATRLASGWLGTWIRGLWPEGGESWQGQRQLRRPPALPPEAGHLPLF